MTARKPLDHYLGLQYPFQVIADPTGGYVIVFTDLPGCMTQVETTEEISPMADEVRRLWIETEYEEGEDIPLPSYPEEYSGKFNLRLPKSLHRHLAESAERDGVSLNQFVMMVLAQGEIRRQASRDVMPPWLHEGGSAAGPSDDEDPASIAAVVPSTGPRMPRYTRIKELDWLVEELAQIEARIREIRTTGSSRSGP